MTKERDEWLPGIYPTASLITHYRVNHRSKEIGTYDTLEKANAVKLYAMTYFCRDRIPNKQNIKAAWFKAVLNRDIPAPVRGRNTNPLIIKKLNLPFCPHSNHVTDENQEVPIGVTWHTDMKVWLVGFKRLRTRNYEQFEDAKAARLWMEKNAFAIHEKDDLEKTFFKAVETGAIPRPRNHIKRVAK